jgi:hypothetical protein
MAVTLVACAVVPAPVVAAEVAPVVAAVVLAFPVVAPVAPVAPVVDGVLVVASEVAVAKVAVAMSGISVSWARAPGTARRATRAKARIFRGVYAMVKDMLIGMIASCQDCVTPGHEDYNARRECTTATRHGQVEFVASPLRIDLVHVAVRSVSRTRDFDSRWKFCDFGLRHDFVIKR